MTIPSSGDRRNARRVDTQLSGDLQGSEQLTCRVANLSRTGALAISSSPLEEMNVVRIRVHVATDDGRNEDFSCEAAVVRCDKRPDGEYDIGLYFTSLDKEERATLQRLLESGALTPAR